MGATVFAVEKLKIESNPFDTGLGGRVGRPLQKALGEVIRQIGLEAPVVVVSGSPGTGKTLLAKMAKRACADMGLSVRRIDRGDFAEIAGGQRSDVLLVDEADSLPESTSHLLLFEGDKRPATTTVLLCLPASIRRFSSVTDAVFVELTRLSQSDTRLYLQERATQAGLPDLFAPAALDLLIDASRGVPRSLWSIAGLAYFSAACAGASQISRQNVADAAASQTMRPEIPEGAAPAAPSVKLVTETPVRPPAASAVANPPRTSESVALFPGANLNSGPIKRGHNVETPTLRSASQDALDRSTSAPSAPPSGTMFKRPEAVAEPMAELPRSIAEALDPSAAARGELPIDRKARDVWPVQPAHSEPKAVRGPDDHFVFADAPAARTPDRLPVAESVSEMPVVARPSASLVKPIPQTPVTPGPDTLPAGQPKAEKRAEPAIRAQIIQRAIDPQIESLESAEATSIAQRFAPAQLGMQRAPARRPLVTIGNAAAVAVALAAGVALTLYIQPMLLNEKAAVATDAKTIAVIAPAVTAPPSIRPEDPPTSTISPAPGIEKARAAGQTAGRNGAARRTARATQRLNETSAQRANETRAVEASAVALGTPPTTALAAPLNDAANEATIRAEAARAAAEADAIAAAVVASQQRAERDRMVKEAAARAQTAAIQDVGRAAEIEAAARAARAAQAEAAREALRQRRLLDASSGFHLKTGQ